MRSWPNDVTDPDRPSAVLGPLERRVLEALWAREAPATVRDLVPVFPDAAYTTLMTTLDRLHRKGMLSRQKSGRAFLYQPRLGRSEFERARTAEAFRSAVASADGSLAPLVSCLVDAVGERDRELLDELEQLVAARRGERKGKRP
jgi:predicted transcriptional regulator